jgi:hypothetical protein
MLRSGCALFVVLAGCAADGPDLDTFPRAPETVGAEPAPDPSDAERQARAQVQDELHELHVLCHGALAEREDRADAADRRLASGRLAALAAIILGESTSQNETTTGFSPQPQPDPRSPLATRARGEREAQSRYVLRVNEDLDALTRFLDESADPGGWSAEQWRAWHAQLDATERDCRILASAEP